MRGWLVRKKMAGEGVVSNPADKAQRLHNYSVISFCLKDQSRVPQSCERSLFAGNSFILAGPVPKFNKKKITQAAVVNMIRDNGAMWRKMCLDLSKASPQKSMSSCMTDLLLRRISQKSSRVHCTEGTTLLGTITSSIRCNNAHSWQPMIIPPISQIKGRRSLFRSISLIDISVTTRPWFLW